MGDLVAPPDSSSSPECESTPLPESESAGRAKARYASVRPHAIPLRQRPSDDVAGPSVIVEASLLRDGMMARHAAKVDHVPLASTRTERLAVAAVFVGLLVVGALAAFALR